MTMRGVKSPNRPDHPNSMYYKDVISKSLFLKDLAKKSPKFLIPKDRTKGVFETDSRIGQTDKS